jgi:RNA polymerase sigma-70 factor (sigma-E family)
VDARLEDYVRGQWSPLVRYAAALCGNADEGEERVQAALVRDKDNPDAYVRRAILNGYLNTWRRRRSRETPVADVPETAGADHGLTNVADHVTLRRALRTLAPRQRAVLVLRYLEDMSEQQTADLLGCSVGTVKSQTSKGLARLRAEVGLPDDGGIR